MKIKTFTVEIRMTSYKLRFSTYFVEYQFPVVATSRDKYQPHAMATEVSRVASKKIADRGILSTSSL